MDAMVAWRTQKNNKLEKKKMLNRKVTKYIILNLNQSFYYCGILEIVFYVRELLYKNLYLIINISYIFIIVHLVNIIYGDSSETLNDTQIRHIQSSPLTWESSFTLML